jgi:hypothetical protein
MIANPTQSTYDKFITSLSEKELHRFNDGYRKLVRSEIKLAKAQQDMMAVSKLTKMLNDQRSRDKDA